MKKKVLTCFQCGELLQSEDNFCPNCGEPTLDEKEAVLNPVEDNRSKKR